MLGREASAGIGARAISIAMRYKFKTILDGDGQWLVVDGQWGRARR
jgi:hypothetical protein